MDESEWYESGLKWMKVDDSGWKLMKADESGCKEWIRSRNLKT